ncbi:hypothetical protein [Roseibium sp.]|uniref:hypothetical protein n=1 Tax=Roseibium sp. TaxID=1936156 RepID=UPI00329998D2
MNQKYLILNTESIFDPYLREAYRCIEPACEKARIGSRSLVVMSMWPIEIDSLGRITTGSLASWTLESSGDEASLVKDGFAFMRQHFDHTLVSYGGLGVDCQVLQLAAMAANLTLPRQLAEAQGPRWKDLRHIDLGLALKGPGKTWHHLSEVLLRLGVPVAPLLGKADPAIRPDEINWSQIEQHCELDVLFTAMALVAWVRLQGRTPMSIPAGHLALLESFHRRRPDTIREPILRRMVEDLRSDLGDGRNLAT